MRSVFVVEVTVDTGDLDPTDLRGNIESAVFRGVDRYWVVDLVGCEVLDVYPAPRETRDVQHQGRLL